MAKTRHVAVLIETSRAYGRGLLEGVARYHQQHGHWSIYFEPHGIDDPPPRWLKKWAGDGILVRVNNPEMGRVIQSSGLPAVELRSRYPRRDWASIGINNASVAKLAAGHLLDRGFEHFAFTGPRRGDHMSMDERRLHFTAAIEQAGRKCYCFDAPKNWQRLTWEQQLALLNRWTRSLPRPVGVMVCNDDWGHQLLEACRRERVAVPDEVAVIGVDNDTILCNLAAPALTSIDVNTPRIGYEAAALLDRMMGGAAAPDEHVQLEPVGVVPRLSTDILAIDDRELAAALRFIRAHACEGIRIDDVLRAVPVSRSTLERRFREVLGRSPKREILRLQIERAKSLLLGSEQPVKWVAGSAGFQSPKYFSDAFERMVGMRPEKFRKRVSE
jgi:LacI family transcriptional regulator